MPHRFLLDESVRSFHQRSHRQKLGHQKVNFEPTDSGANVEVVRAKGSPWRVKMTLHHELQMVSPWRAWMEIANQGGRVQELADELIGKLLSQEKNP